MNRTKKKVPQKTEIAFNFTREIPIKTMYLHFYMRNPLKKLKTEIAFNFTKEIRLKIIQNKKKSTMKFGLKNTL